MTQRRQELHLLSLFSLTPYTWRYLISFGHWIIRNSDNVKGSFYYKEQRLTPVSSRNGGYFDNTCRNKENRNISPKVRLHRNWKVSQVSRRLKRETNSSRTQDSLRKQIISSPPGQDVFLFVFLPVNMIQLLSRNQLSGPQLTPHLEVVIGSVNTANTATCSQYH